VEALVASHEQAPSFLESHTLRLRALLTEHGSDFMVGQRIGPMKFCARSAEAGWEKSTRHATPGSTGLML
jgi:hypothetical protein